MFKHISNKLRIKKSLVFDDVSHKNLWNFILSCANDERKLDSLLTRNEDIKDLYDLKVVFFRRNKIYSPVVNLCFPCQYAKSRGDNLKSQGVNVKKICELCPFIMDKRDVTKDFDCLNGLYDLADRLFSTFVRIRKKIIKSEAKEDITIYELSSRYVQSALIKSIEKIISLPVREDMDIKLASKRIRLFKFF